MDVLRQTQHGGIAAAVLVASGCAIFDDDERFFPEARSYSETVCAPWPMQCWMADFQPSGQVDYLPTGDISFRGTYVVTGNRVLIRADQSPTFRLELSADEDTLRLEGAPDTRLVRRR